MTRRPMISAGIFLGAGLGGFIDGILLHQIFQLHSMLTAKYPKDSIANYQINMLWDGLFHAVTWLFTVIGLALLWNVGKRSDVPWSGRLLLGGMLAGWGLFNFFEGIVNHHVLHTHHVLEAAGGVSWWDYVFLASGVALVAAGVGLIAWYRGQRGDASRSERESAA